MNCPTCKMPQEQTRFQDCRRAMRNEEEPEGICVERVQFTIYAYFVQTDNGLDDEPLPGAGYTALSLTPTPTARLVATVSGNLTAADLGFGCTGLVIADYPYPSEPSPFALRDVLGFARCGMYGLMVIP